MNITWTILKDARGVKGWTQQQLADAVGVSLRTVVNWEANGVPSSSVYKVRRALGDAIDYASYVGSMPDDVPLMSIDEWREWVGDLVFYREDEDPDAPANALDELRAEPQGDTHDKPTEESERKRKMLGQFSDSELLGELSIRMSQMRAEMSLHGISNVIEPDPTFWQSDPTGRQAEIDSIVTDIANSAEAAQEYDQGYSELDEDDR